VWHDFTGGELPFAPFDVVEHGEPLQQRIDVHIAAERIEHRLDLMFIHVDTSV